MSDFSDRSAHLALPYIQPAQAQKHVTHNEALRRLDGLVHLSVASASLSTPPAAPETGLRHILPAGAVGAWAGQAQDRLAIFEGTGWSFVVPRRGWIAWVEDENLQRIFDGSAWRRLTEISDYQNLPQLGVQTRADTTNRLAVAGAATLLTHAGAGHQLKLNKAGAGETASLLFQTDWSGRAEMGTTGSDDFEIKVSADGSVFHAAMVAEAATGKVAFPQGVRGLAPSAFGSGPLLTTDYTAARGLDLVTNGTGLLGNSYNYPDSFTHDPQQAPNLPASFSYAGYSTGLQITEEFLPIDPNRIYRLSSYLRQEGVPGDWSAWANAERHQQFMGLICFDRDGLTIESQHHMRYRHNGTDSLTTLAAPLAPGDRTIYLSDAGGWNESDAASRNRGVTLFAYRNAQGYSYNFYSRLTETELFDLGAVDKTAHTVTLNTPLPASLGNPDDPSGIWPSGTRIANASRGSTYKYSFYSTLILPDCDHWYQTESHIGGIDRSGANVAGNFPPGTAFAKLFWLPNYSNRPGGYSVYPDTGAAHRVWFAGISVTPEPLAMMQTTATGAQTIKVPRGDFSSGTISLVTADVQVSAL